MADDDFSLPDDAMVEVLLLLPTSSRRRFRLVCKRWRDLIDERTPDWKARTKILVFIPGRGSSRVVVFDDKEGTRRRHAWRYWCSHDGRYDLVGTCNGLLCLHERTLCAINAASCNSTIAVTNPITGESRILPPAPAPTLFMAFGKYSFGYHPTTGEYKVVHIPCRQGQAVRAVWVLTLGGSESWREVPVLAPDASYHHSCEAVSVDGFTYWLDAHADRVMALDLEDERVTCFDVPPALRGPEQGGWRLTSVHARLGIAKMTSWEGVEVWVLESGGGGGQPRWARGCTLPEPRGHLGRWITAPHLTVGEYAMSRSWGMARLYRHKVGSLIDRDGNNRLPPLLEEKGELVLDDDTRNYDDMKTFAYVESLEPLPAIDGPPARDDGLNQPRAANGGTLEKNVRL